MALAVYSIGTPGHRVEWGTRRGAWRERRAFWPDALEGKMRWRAGCLIFMPSQTL